VGGPRDNEHQTETNFPENYQALALGGEPYIVEDDCTGLLELAVLEKKRPDFKKTGFCWYVLAGGGEPQLPEPGPFIREAKWIADRNVSYAEMICGPIYA